MSNLPPQLHPKYRPDIDGLRAIAVLSVVTFHAFPEWLSGGFIGVDIFFVISGYLISMILFENLNTGIFSFSQFYVRRVMRIFPALILVLVSCFAFGWFFLIANPFMQLGKHIAAGAGFISNLVLWKEAGYFDQSADIKPLLHLWSLGIEEQFYFVWPAMLWLAWKKRFSFLPLIILVSLVSFVINIALANTNSNADFYSPFSRFWELLVGSLLAYAVLYKKDFMSTLAGYRHLASITGLSLFVIGLFALNKTSQFPGWWALLPSIGGLLLIFSGPNVFINRVILSNKVFVWFGLISYSLYLWHWPLLVCLRIILGDVPNVQMRIFIVVLSIFLAWLTYQFIERPIRFGGNYKTKLTILMVAMTLVGGMGYLTYKHDGLKSRFINRLNSGVSEALSYDWERGLRHGECFIDDIDNDTNKFSSICGKKQNGHSLLIWGDSHSATLYRGFEEFSKSQNYGIYQFSASGCPPILDFYISNRKECINSNKFVYKEIERLKPETVVLSAYWSMYDGNDWEKLDTNKLLATIAKLKLLGIQNIVLIGPLPIFKTNQADLLMRYTTKGSVSTRSYHNFKTMAVDDDKKLKDVAKNSQITYISALNILCNGDGCLLSVPGENIKPLSYDYGHLTTNGSIYLVSKFFELNQIKISH